MCMWPRPFLWPFIPVGVGLGFIAARDDWVFSKSENKIEFSYFL